MCTGFIVITEENSSIPEAVLRKRNRGMFTDEIDDGKYLNWTGMHEDLEKLECGNLRAKRINGERGNFMVRTFDGVDFACRIYEMYTPDNLYHAVKYCIRFRNSIMGRPRTLIIPKGTIMGLYLSESTCHESQYGAFELCFESMNAQEDDKDGENSESFWSKIFEVPYRWVAMLLTYILRRWKRFAVLALLALWELYSGGNVTNYINLCFSSSECTFKYNF